MSNKRKQSSGRSPEQAQVANRAEQLNPDSEKFWKARGYEKRPENWETLLPSLTPPPTQDE